MFGLEGNTFVELEKLSGEGDSEHQRLWSMSRVAYTLGHVRRDAHGSRWKRWSSLAEDDNHCHYCSASVIGTAGCRRNKTNEQVDEYVSDTSLMVGYCDEVIIKASRFYLSCPGGGA